MDTGLEQWIAAALEHERRWESGFGPFEPAPELAVDGTAAAAAFGELLERLEDNYPYFHPRYAGQMLKPPHPLAIAGYLAAMLVNPNNHALDGGPATARMELEAVESLARMVGFERHLGHLTSSGTMANLEALFVARERHPDLGVAFSAEAHYTHGRMCHLLGVRPHVVGTDGAGRIDLDEVEELARGGLVGTVVLTLGTTGLGAVDRVDEALRLKERYGLRLHVDGAYGGFFTILAHESAGALPPGLDPAPFRAVASCDSFVVDPHKHGLQPYGCGAVLFADPDVARHYAHESPYTYFTGGGARHLGETRLECSRAGAAAAAFWLTLRLFPLGDEGLGGVLRTTLAASRALTSRLEASELLVPYQPPELDIVTFLSRRSSTPEAVDAFSAAMFEACIARDDPVFLSVLRVGAGELARRHPGGDAVEVGESPPETSRGVRILRSVLMKPEAAAFTSDLVDVLEEVAGAL